MPRQDLSREELFALVWEKPTQEIAKELGISDVAVGKMCARLQVPKPPRGYWAKVQSGKQPRRSPLKAFRKEVEERRLKAERARAAHVFTKLRAARFLEETVAASCDVLDSLGSAPSRAALTALILRAS